MRRISLNMMSMLAVCAIAIPVSAQQGVVDADAVGRPAPDSAGYYKASDLIGMDVRGTDNADLGEVQDLFVNHNTNEIEFLILDTGVLADLDGKQPVIPWTIVERRVGSDADTYFLSVPLTEARIKTAPMVNLRDVALTGTPEWRTQVTDFYDAEIRERRVARPDLDREGVRNDANRDDADRNQTNRPRQGQRPRTETSPDTSDRPDAKNRPGAGNRPGTRPEANRPNSTKPESRTPNTPAPDADTPKADNPPKPKADAPKPDADKKPATP